MLDVTQSGVASKFLNSFDRALANKNIAAVLDHFVEDCFWRDLISFTWNIKTMEGKEAIGQMLVVGQHDFLG